MKAYVIENDRILLKNVRQIDEDEYISTDNIAVDIFYFKNELYESYDEARKALVDKLEKDLCQIRLKLNRLYGGEIV